MEDKIAKRNEEVSKILKNIPTGKPKSGRKWKSKRIRSHTEFKIGTSNLKTSFEDKMKKKAEQKSVKDFENRLKTERQERLQVKRQKVKEKRQRKLENEKKNEIVTPITKAHKIKKTKKKLLRVVKS